MSLVSYVIGVGESTTYGNLCQELPAMPAELASSTSVRLGSNDPGRLTISAARTSIVLIIPGTVRPRHLLSRTASDRQVR